MSISSPLSVLLVSESGRMRLRSDPILVGRGSRATLKLDGGGVSRKHAVVERSGDDVVVRDLGSGNGTFVNGTRIDEPTKLRHNDVLGIGNHAIQIIVATETVSTRRPISETVARPDVEIPLEGVSHLGAPSALWSDELEDEAAGAIALGKLDRAIALLGPRLADTLRAARRGESNAEAREWATRFATELAIATDDSKWLDYIFEIYTLAAEPPPPRLLGPLGEALTGMPDYDREVARAFVRKLRSESRSMTNRQRIAISALEDLVEVV